ncbi:MAG: membrane-targeted effector domain-containing toxin, partial [Simkania sp.]|nr:membrane-targeted effector domain-containing toxin [Simkania sp.]
MKINKADKTHTTPHYPLACPTDGGRTSAARIQRQFFQVSVDQPLAHSAATGTTNPASKTSPIRVTRAILHDSSTKSTISKRARALDYISRLQFPGKKNVRKADPQGPVKTPRLDFHTPYIVLEIPENRYQEVKKEMSIFIDVQEEKIQDKPGYVYLRLGCTEEEVRHSSILEELLEQHSFPRKTKPGTTHQEFCEEAKGYLNSREFKGLVPLPEDIQGIPIRDCLAAETAVMEKILHHYRGFCLGETHTTIAPKLLLAELMPALAKLGVTTLFFEGVLFDTMQPLLDRYNASPPDALFPPILQERFKNIDLGQRMPHSLNYSTVIKAAHLHGIQVVGIDTTRAYYQENGDKQSRVMLMNYDALRIIEEKLTHIGGKYVVFTGLAHAIRTSDPHDSIPWVGLGELLQVPSIEISSSFREQDLPLSIQFWDRSIWSPVDPVQVLIQRPLIPNLSGQELEMFQFFLDIQLDGREKKDIPEEELSTWRKRSKHYLNLLYQYASSPLLTDLMKTIHFYCQIQSSIENEAKRRKFYASQYRCEGVFNGELSKQVCHLLNAQKPKHLRFNPASVGERYITGGACTALALDYINRLLSFKSLFGISSTLQLVADMDLKASDNYQDMRVIQAAFNAIQKVGECSGDFKRDKIDAMLGLYGRTTSAASKTIQLSDEHSLEHLQQLLPTLPEGIFLIRTLLPARNLKEEEHGHSMVLIKEGDALFFYDPNLGGFELPKENPVETLYEFLQSCYLEWNTPDLRFYQIDESTGFSAVPFILQSNTTKIPSHAFSSLDPQRQQILLWHPNQVNQYIDQVGSYEGLLTCPLKGLLHLIGGLTWVIQLRQEGIPLELLSRYPVESLVALICSRENALVLYRESFLENISLQQQPKLLQQFLWKLDAAISLSKAGMTPEVLAAYSIENVRAFLQYPEAAIELRQEGLLDNDFLQQHPELGECIPQNSKGAISLSKAGITPEVLTAYSIENVKAFLQHPKAAIELRQEGLLDNDFLQQHPELRKCILRNSKEAITLSKAGITPEVLAAYSIENVKAFLQHPEAAVELRQEGLLDDDFLQQHP